jgi:hypothetical protein
LAAAILALRLTVALTTDGDFHRLKKLGLHFLVLCVAAAVFAVLWQFNAFGILRFVFCCRIVFALALGTFHINDRLHLTLLN